MTWKVEKPNKNGLWLWRFIRNIEESEYQQSIVGLILVKENKVKDHDTKYPLDVWWDILDVETHYIGEYE